MTKRRRPMVPEPGLPEGDRALPTTVEIAPIELPALTAAPVWRDEDADAPPTHDEGLPAIAAAQLDEPEAAGASDEPIIEAATSPATTSDVLPDAAPPAVNDQGTSEMATVASPNETIEKSTAAVGDIQERATAAFEKSTKISEDVVEFAKGNVEALMASARVAAKASEALSQEAAEYGRKSMEHATAAFKSFATVKSPTELFQLQSDFAKASFDSAVANASKLSEAMMKYAGEIAQPISNRYAVAAEKLKVSGS